MTNYNPERFADIVGDSVDVVDGEGNSRKLIVTAVKSSQIESEDWQSYSIFFQGEPGFHFTQGNYTIRHTTFEQENLFLSPKSLVDYEAVISSSKTNPA